MISALGILLALDFTDVLVELPDDDASFGTVDNLRDGVATLTVSHNGTTY